MNKIKLVAIDIDGTLVTDQKIINKENKKSINDLQNKGLEIVISTGRIPFSASGVAKEIGGNIHISACNGAMVLLQKNKFNHKILSYNLFDNELAKKVINFIDSKNIKYHFYETQHLYTNRGEELAENFYALYMKDIKERIVYADPLASALNDDLNIMKIGVYNDKTFDFDKLEQELKDFGGLSICKSNERYLDINPQNVNKWQALQKIAKDLEIDTSEIIYFGDQENDIECIMKSGIGVAMKNAPEYIRELADFVTEEDNNSSGLSKFIESHKDIF